MSGINTPVSRILNGKSCRKYVLRKQTRATYLRVEFWKFPVDREAYITIMQCARNRQVCDKFIPYICLRDGYLKRTMPIHPPELYFHFTAQPLYFGLGSVMQKELIFYFTATFQTRFDEYHFIKILQ